MRRRKRRKEELVRLEQSFAFWRGEASRLGWRLRDAEKEIARLRAAPDLPAAPEDLPRPFDGEYEPVFPPDGAVRLAAVLEELEGKP